jgi:hypothetical protein
VRKRFSYIAIITVALLSLAGGAFGITRALQGADARSSKTQTAAALPAPVACPGCWHPALETSWQWQLDGTIDQSFDVDMYDVDLFTTSADIVKSLHDQGRKVICYIDVGGWEKYRPDAAAIPSDSPVLGKTVEGWPDEKWLDVRQLTVIGPPIQARLDLCKSKGFDGAELDLVDGYTNKTGFPLTATDQLQFNSWLANEAHLRGLSVAQKNDPEQAETLVTWFDWALSEECFNYKECDSFQPYIDQGKPVMEVEYELKTADFCPDANEMNFNALKKNLDLDAPREACR